MPVQGIVWLIATRNTSLQSSRTTSPIQTISQVARQSSWRSGTPLARKNMTVSDHFPIQKPIFFLFASPSTAPIPSRMSWTKYVPSKTPQCTNVVNTFLQWYPEVLHFCPNTPLILVGLKSDLRDKRDSIDLLKAQGLTPVTPEQGQNVAKQMNAIYVECSSKEMSGVHEIFELAVDTVVGQEVRMKEQRQTQPQYSGNTVVGGAGKFSKKSKRRGPCSIL